MSTRNYSINLQCTAVQREMSEAGIANSGQIKAKVSSEGETKLFMEALSPESK